VTTQTISEQAEALAAQFATHAPADVIEAFAAEQRHHDEEGVPAGVPAPGAPMPDGQLLDTQGRPTALTQARAGRAAVVVFYRGAWCPYCNLTLRTYQRELVPDLEARGIPLIAVSPQKPDGSLTMQETNELSYTVLSDPGNQIAGQLGILTAPSDAARAAQGKLGLDLTEVNADGTATLPMPTTVLVDAAGIIRWIDVHPNYTTRSEPPEIIDAVQTHLP
jgi:peroxiredoxin